jgi:adenosylmethionine-8-amino-7-oxononanoate aminotransferase
VKPRQTLARLDHAHVWHPFTQMRDWLKSHPIILERGEGARLWDRDGREYLDGNSSIWTNLHGHNHPRLNAAVKAQLGKVAHTSSLGLTNEPAIRLAAELIQAVRRPAPKASALQKVFYSDDGSTAIETALKLAYEYTRRTRGGRQRPRFLSLKGGYHGDTVGAVSLGHIDLFHSAFQGLLFKSDAAMAPYCYRCPYNRAKPERADARTYRKCRWECVDQVGALLDSAQAARKPYAAMTLEPSIQGAAGMIPQPEGWLSRVAELVRDHHALLITDEVLTGFGRAGGPGILASQQEGVTPDLVALAKGLTGGYLPMAATLTTDAIYEAFLGEYGEFKTFFHGHSYNANPLGAATARASLQLVETATGRAQRQRLARWMDSDLQTLWEHPHVGDIRQVGLIAGIELVRNWRDRTPFPLTEQVGIRVCASMARRGVLTRPIGNVVVLMPPYCTTRIQWRRMVSALREALAEVLDVRAQPKGGLSPT